MTMNGQCGWMFGCFVVALLHHKSDASSAPSNVDHSTQQTPQSQTQEDQEKETEAESESFCHTLHIMDSQGDSVVVNKKCADLTECSPGRVGCVHIDSQKVCVACCDEMYCNKSVPTNHSTAVFSNERTRLMERIRQQAENNTWLNSAVSQPQLNLAHWFSLTLAILLFA